MIRYSKVTDKGVEIEQIGSRPSVYLDNWALNLFASDDPALGKRFAGLLNRLRGTLNFSTINLLEIVNRDDKNQVSKITNFVDLMDGVFIDFNPMKVIEKENKARRTSKIISKNSPSADLRLLEAHALYVHDPLKPFKISEVILALQEEMRNTGHVIEADFETGSLPVIERARNDSNALAKAKKRSNDKSRRIRTEFPYTQDLLSRFIDFVVINEAMRMPNKEWRDAFHVIVPVAYCDFVLIDSRWIAFIQSTGLTNPEIAKVYGGNNIEEFLSDLVNFVE